LGKRKFSGRNLWVFIGRRAEFLPWRKAFAIRVVVRPGSVKECSLPGLDEIFKEPPEPGRRHL
jgi:hypothetical protein